jgi:hypothetical protein
LSQHEHLEVWWNRMQKYADCDNWNNDDNDRTSTR